MCEEESDDAEAVAKLLEINDSIHRTIERYKLVKKGDVEAAAKIPKGTLGTSTGVGKNAANELSLIDFEPEPSANGGPSSSQTEQTIEDDLLGLSVQDQPFGQSGDISLGFGTNTSKEAIQPNSLLLTSYATDIPGPALLSSTTQASRATAPAPAASPPPQNQHSTSPRPNYDVFAALSVSQPPSKPATPAPTMFQQQQQQLYHKQPPPASTSSDPFAALVSSRTATPQPSQAATSSAPLHDSLLDISGISGLQGATPPNAAPAVGASSQDDEWTFASSLPETTLPSSNNFTVSSSIVKIEFMCKRTEGSSAVNILALFSNLSSQPVTGLHFQLAVEKGYNLQLKPQTGRDIGPGQQQAVRQEIQVNGVEFGKGNAIKMRWKASYNAGGQAKEEQGNVPSLGIA